ncbi:uncharacterized protein LOC125232679 [Leguminivora glycinivorella]|uniref:uncharacterized protein LOC125232679 n=1 Tax=Leguminivora glycinivorella TaxID=1035111 RepID=UPI002010AFF9|nr:uncharacterized protein LOC125232679 [Leguminivora glycinivorella]
MNTVLNKLPQNMSRTNHLKLVSPQQYLTSSVNRLYGHLTPEYPNGSPFYDLGQTRPPVNKAPDMTTNAQISVMHQNINRLQNKTYRLECELQLRDPAVDVLCLTEHWLEDNQISSVNIQNYSLRAQYCRTSRQGGGTCIYAKTDLVTMERKEISALSVEMNIELCAIECIGADLIIVCIYRPPNGDVQLYLSKLSELLSMHAIKNYNVLLIGDINIDLMVKCNLNKNLNNTITQFGFRQLIKIPTRINNLSSTCIDHAFTNISMCNIQNVFSDELNLSDHLSINVTVKILKQGLSNKHILKRNFTNSSIYNFVNNLELYNWNHICDKCICPSKKIELVINVLKHYFNICFPLRKTLIKNNSCAWVTDTIRQLRFNIRKLKQNISRDPHDSESRSKLLKNETLYWNSLRDSRSNYLNNQIENSNTDMCRSIWRVIASETCKNRNNKNSAINVLISKSAGDSNDARAADAARRLNRYYINANKNNVKPCARTALEYLDKYLPSLIPTFKFEPYSLSDIMQALKKIKRKQSQDINDMSTYLLDYLPPVVISILLVLFNECIYNGTYPDALKLIKIQPIYKGKGDMEQEKVIGLFP